MAKFVTQYSPEIFPFSWEIEKFDLLPIDHGNCIRSPPFTLPGEKTFVLKIYPKGSFCSKEDEIAVKLELIGSRQECKVVLECALFIHPRYKFSEVAELSLSTYRQLDAGWDCFTTRKLLLSDCLRLSGTQVTAQWRISLLSGVPFTRVCCVNHAQVVSTCVQSNVNMCDTTVKNIDDLLKDMRRLFDDQLCTDVTFNVAGEEIPAHKCILASRSPVFAAMFRHDMKEQCESCIVVSDIGAEVMKSMLLFLYTGKVVLGDIHKVRALYGAADKYQLTYLKNKCATYLAMSLTSSNVVDVFQFAYLHNDEILQRTAKEFISACPGLALTVFKSE